MLQRLKSIYERNSFHLRANYPHVVVIRNTDPKTLAHIADDGTNICDTVALVDADALIYLRGRSYPHIKYQREQVEGKSACNYIASGYYANAWRRGIHRGFEALVQNRSFTIYRSRDLVLGNEDDYVQTDIVADNFHGYAPFSAGCVTVEGKMNPPEGAWKIAHEWIFRKHAEIPTFSVVILNHADLTDTGVSLRLGSMGDAVSALQRALKLRDDGEFGPMTFAAVIAFQRSMRLEPTGIADQRTLSILHGGKAA
jgi:hypothetical protein